MAIQPSEHRTWLSSVAFLDVVGFSKHSIQGQLEIKQHLDSVIRRHLEGISREDFIFLDRGDGAAVCFLGEPEVAFFFAVQVRDTLRSEAAERPEYEIRAGINLGPIKIIHDVNGDRAPVGEGINCAARVMDFAGANEIFVARSFYDVIGCQSAEYAELFSYLGTRADKHVRQFEIYQVVPPGGKRESEPQHQVPQPPAADATPAVTFDQAFLDALRAALARAIGPMAGLLVDRAVHHAQNRDDLLECLGAALQDQGQREDFFSSIGLKPPPPRLGIEAAPEPPVAKAAEQQPAQPLSPELQEQARSALARRLGPFAAVLVKKAAASGGDADEFLERLAAKIPDTADRELFLTEVYAAKHQ